MSKSGSLSDHFSCDGQTSEICGAACMQRYGASETNLQACLCNDSQCMQKEMAFLKLCLFSRQKNTHGEQIMESKYKILKLPKIEAKIPVSF